MISLKAKILSMIFLFFSGFTLLLAYFTGIVKPLIVNKCEAELRTYVQQAVNSAITDAADYELFTELIKFSYSPDGKIAAYSADMLASSRIRAAIGNGLTEDLVVEKETLLTINSGIFSGVPFLYSRGRPIDVLIDGFIFSELNVASEFTDAGINQTLHRIYLEVDAVSHIKAPFINENISTETRIPISETVLIGDVPDAYTVIIRAHEEDEEDINDYAADLEN